VRGIRARHRRRRRWRAPDRVRRTW
jgi:hypothetical protein